MFTQPHSVDNRFKEVRKAYKKPAERITLKDVSSRIVHNQLGLEDGCSFL
jgi:hypothetical protein